MTWSTHARSTRSGGTVGWRAIRGDPVESPFERPHDALGRADVGEAFFPAVKKTIEIIGWRARAPRCARRAADRRCVHDGPTICRPMGRPARLVPQGRLIAGWPREVEGLRAAQHGGADRFAAAHHRHGRRAERRRLDGQRRQQQRIDAFERARDFVANDRPAAQRAHVVLARHAPAHLDPQPDAVGVGVRPPLERPRVVRGGIGQNQVQIDRRDVERVRHATPCTPWRRRARSCRSRRAHRRRRRC